TPDPPRPSHPRSCLCARSCFFFHRPHHHRDLYSFPTRRSSDLFDQDLVVQMRPGRPPRVARPPDHGAALNSIADLHVRLREMSIDALDVLAVIDYDRDPVLLVCPCDGDGAAGGSADRSPELGADV